MFHYLSMYINKDSWIFVHELKSRFILKILLLTFFQFGRLRSSGGLLHSFIKTPPNFLIFSYFLAPHHVPSSFFFFNLYILFKISFFGSLYIYNAPAIELITSRWSPGCFYLNEVFRASIRVLGGFIVIGLSLL